MIKPKKLVFCVFPISFFISHRLPIALEALQKGYEVHLVSTTGEGEEVIKNAGIILHKIEITRSKANIFQECRTIKSIYSIYKKINPDIVHNITIKPVLYSTLAARLTNVSAIVNAFSGLGYIFIARGFKATVARILVIIAYKTILRHSNLRSIVQNQDDKQYLISKSIIKSEQTVLIRGSGVNLQEYLPTSEPTGIPVVILPARLLKDKGVVEFAKAAKILRDKGKNIRMVLVGEVDMGNPSSVTKEELKQWVDDGFVEHWGFCQDMAKVFKKANIVCLPSYREGLPKSLIEACAAGRAIITTNVPGCREMVDRENENGVLIAVKDVQALAKAIEDLVNNPEKRSAMGTNGRKLAESEFSIDTVVNKTLSIYDEIST
jgi:glycosyltransferase involved in cell wall biosynthesis